METLLTGLSTFGLGFGTVFVGLICLILIIKLMSVILAAKPAKDKSAAPAGQQAPAPSAAAPEIDMSNVSPYDQGCNEGIQTAFKDYFNGVIDLDTAKANFETLIMEKYPDLTEVVWP